MNCEGMYQTFYKKLYNTIFAMVRDHYLTEDIVQDTFIKAFVKFDTISATEKAGAWLTVIAKRTAIDAIRKESRRVHVSIEDIDQYFSEISEKYVLEDEVQCDLLKERVEHEIKLLSVDQRAIIHHKVNNGLKEKEIADKLDIRSGTVKIKLYRARKQLKEKIYGQTYSA
ncbi:RNA polymerase sigma factor [Bacillus salitolerans]|uniref:RNA polymerase sigma factor n=1 Tax=Bacillus salitolerans TaxID=1437434 RepID=A0ABW4LUC4_9BACI